MKRITAQWKVEGLVTRCTLIISNGEKDRGGIDTYLETSSTTAS